MSDHQQNRITLGRMQISERSSRETVCFKATVVFDGQPIAVAENEGRGGITVIQALSGTDPELTQARAFANALPPYIRKYTERSGTTTVGEQLMSLELLIDLLAGRALEEKRLRIRFKRAYGKRLLFVSGTEILYPKEVFLPACSAEQIERFVADIRGQYGPDTPILIEMKRDEALALWLKVLLPSAL